MRSDKGPRRLIVYCADFKCSHSVIIRSSIWPNHFRPSDLEPRFTCKAVAGAAPMSGRYIARSLFPSSGKVRVHRCNYKDRRARSHAIKIKTVDNVPTIGFLHRFWEKAIGLFFSSR